MLVPHVLNGSTSCFMWKQLQGPPNTSFFILKNLQVPHVLHGSNSKSSKYFMFNMEVTPSPSKYHMFYIEVTPSPFKYFMFNMELTPSPSKYFMLYMKVTPSTSCFIWTFLQVPHFRVKVLEGGPGGIVDPPRGLWWPKWVYLET